VCILLFVATVPFANGQACSPTAPQVILNGGFEDNAPPVDPPWPEWTIQSSTNFGTPICSTNPLACGSILSPTVLPRTGEGWLLFGFNVGFEELAQAGQTINVASTSLATLRFWMRVSEVDAPDLDDTLDIRVDGVSVATFTEPAAPEANYTERTVNFVLATGSRTILFDFVIPENTTPPFGNTNFLIDDISLNLCTPTATTADVSVRVINSNGRGLANATVTLTDQFGVTRTATTSTFGFYTFEDVLVGRAYVLQAVLGRYVFPSQVVTIDSDMSGVNFVAGR
jgi:hypothetical protein